MFCVLQVKYRPQQFHYTTNAHIQCGQAYNQAQASPSLLVEASSSHPTRPTPSTSQRPGPAASGAVTDAPSTPTAGAAALPATAAAPFSATAWAAHLRPPSPRSPWVRSKISTTWASSTVTTWPSPSPPSKGQASVATRDVWATSTPCVRWVSRWDPTTTGGWWPARAHALPSTRPATAALEALGVRSPASPPPTPRSSKPHVQELIPMLMMIQLALPLALVATIWSLSALTTSFPFQYYTLF